MLGVEPRASYMQSKHSPAELHPPAPAAPRCRLPVVHPAQGDMPSLDGPTTPLGRALLPLSCPGYAIVPRAAGEGGCPKGGLVRELNPGPLAPKARIIPLDQRAGVLHPIAPPAAAPHILLGVWGGQLMLCVSLGTLWEQGGSSCHPWCMDPTAGVGRGALAPSISNSHHLRGSSSSKPPPRLLRRLTWPVLCSIPPCPSSSMAIPKADGPL